MYHISSSQYLDVFFFCIDFGAVLISGQYLYFAVAMGDALKIITTEAASLLSGNVEDDKECDGHFTCFEEMQKS